MRGRLGWIFGALGLAGLVRLVRARRTEVVEAPLPAEGADPRADELRRRLQEARSLEDEREEVESAETPVDEAEPLEASPAERRRRVHEQGRANLDEMRAPEGDDLDSLSGR